MNILIDASGIKQGGGLQVADSICKSLPNFTRHTFVVVLSRYFGDYREVEERGGNVRFVRYDVNKYNLKLLATGRDEFLDKLVEVHNIQVSVCIFGPGLWAPKCKKVSGFARAHLIMPESPYYTVMPFLARWKEKAFNKVLQYYFNRSTDVFFTESPSVTTRVRKLFHKPAVTITNYYSQVFDDRSMWKEHRLPPFDGCTLLTISSFYPHKNLIIAFGILDYLKFINSPLRLRFVYTVSKEEFPTIPDEYKENFLLIGKVDITECPGLYEQCDIAFQPTLLECFTATYPEAMRMKKPIVTTNLDFARGLCGDAALYYDPLNPVSAAETISRLLENPSIAASLIANGEKQMQNFDTYKERAEKLISLCEDVCCEENRFDKNMKDYECAVSKGKLHLMEGAGNQGYISPPLQFRRIIVAYFFEDYNHREASACSERRRVA